MLFRNLRSGGYRLIIVGKQICVYRLISETVFVYHITHGASNYPVTFQRLLQRRKAINVLKSVFPYEKAFFFSARDASGMLLFFLFLWMN